ncbi:MAG: hypothetical protein HQK53_17090 [Oligoflexia bacterium]|nr:hypothetical protein [Oligoflexia bacterium]
MITLRQKKLDSFFLCQLLLILALVLVLVLVLAPIQLAAQYGGESSPSVEIDEDEFNVGGDIFSDYNEDLENSQILEDERFYRYGRFYSLGLSAGLTTFTGNRGRAYQDMKPALGLSLLYFMNFQMSFGIGAAYSKHYMMINDRTVGYDNEGGAGLIEVNMFRSYVLYRYYLDTADLGTAITYSNPYLTLRLEFWNQTNKFQDIQKETNSNGALGVAFGGGMEFPVKIRESYVGVEALYHMINFRDTYTTEFRPAKKGGPGGFENLEGSVMSVFVSYVVSW